MRARNNILFLPCVDKLAPNKNTAQYKIESCKQTLLTAEFILRVKFPALARDTLPGLIDKGWRFH